MNRNTDFFISKHTCLTNLLKFIEMITNYVDQGYPVDGIFLDFQKAFDKVPHGRLTKNQSHGYWEPSGKLD